MPELKTNLWQLLSLLGARPRDLSEAIGADKALVSRWLNGKQKLMPGHGWVGKVANYLLALDGRLKEPVISDVLSAYYPDEALNGENLRRALTHWLTVAGHQSTDQPREHTGLTGLVMRQVEKLAQPEPQEEPSVNEAVPLPQMKNAVVYGVEGVRGSTLQYLEMVTQQPEPKEMLFVCPEGLDMITRDKHFQPRFVDALMKMFAAGHRMSVVVRTDYKVSDIAEFSGPWLVAHLLGYVQSFYYDDFISSSKDKMLAVVPGIMAGRVYETKDGKTYTTIHFDPRTVEETHAQIKRYQSESKQRFHYSLFEHPDGFLRGVAPMPDKPHYQFARLPHFCVAEEDCFRESFALAEDELAVMRLDFSPLLTWPGFFSADTAVRHVFCEEDINEALLKSRHVSQELTAIVGRRVVVSTQSLVNRLVELKKMLDAHTHYELCFLRKEHFEKIRMQIACWGDRAAIGWIPGGKSTACRDYTNVNALTGFCESVWRQIPGFMKGRRAAMGKLNTWLKMAEKYGYRVR